MFVLFSIENLFSDTSPDEDPDFDQENDDLNDLMELVDKVILEPIAIVLDFFQDLNANVIQKSYFLCWKDFVCKIEQTIGFLRWCSAASTDRQRRHPVSPEVVANRVNAIDTHLKTNVFASHREKQMVSKQNIM